MGWMVLTFCSASQCSSRRFPSVHRYMLWLFVFISVWSILFATCFWLLVVNCSINSWNPSSSLVISLSVLGWYGYAAMLLSVTSEFLALLSEIWPLYTLSLLYIFVFVHWPFFVLLLLSLISPGIVSPLYLEVIIIRFFCLRLIPLLFLLVPLVETLIVRIELGFPCHRNLYTSLFASVDAALGFFNKLILDAANNFIPCVSSSIPSMVDSQVFCHLSSRKADLLPLAPVSIPSGLDWL